METTVGMGPVRLALAGVLNLVMLVALNLDELWRPLLGGVVTADFSQVLWAMSLACGVQAAGYLLLWARPLLDVRRAVDFVLAAVSMVSAMVLFQVFPFDFSRFGAWATVLARVTVLLAVVASVVGALVALVKLISNRGAHPPHAHSS